MHPRDAAYVLTVAAAYDKRNPSQAEAYAWGADLGDITRDEAVNAVREHFRSKPDTYLQVGHVIAVVKRHRRTGLDQSARLESAAIAALDPDDPDYTRKYFDAVHRSRRAAATTPEAVPGRMALPSRYESDAERDDRVHRGAARVRAVLAAQGIGEPPPGSATDQMSARDRARLRAAQTGDGHHRKGGITALGDVTRRLPLKRPTAGDIDD